MTTYYAAGPAASGLIEHLLNEINWLRSTVDRLTQRLGAEVVAPGSNDFGEPTTAAVDAAGRDLARRLTNHLKSVDDADPDKLDGYATGYVDGLAARETAARANVLPFRQPDRGKDEDITEIVSRLNRRLTGQPESS